MLSYYYSVYYITPLQHLMFHITTVATTSEICVFAKLLLPIARNISGNFRVPSSTIMFINNILTISIKMQHYAGIYLLQNHSTYFGCPQHPSSGEHETVTAASGTGHSICATTFLQRGLIRPSWTKVVVLIL